MTSQPHNHQTTLPKAAPPVEPSTFAIPDVSKATLFDLLGQSTWLTLSRGDRLPGLVAYVAEGVIGVSNEAIEGRQPVCALFHAGDLIDLRRDDQDADVLAKALNTCRLLVFDASSIDSAVATHSDLAAFWIRQVRAHAAVLRDHCADLSCKTPMERLATMLLELRSWPENQLPFDAEALLDAAHAERLQLPIRRNDIASYIGIQPETVSRVFKRLEDEGLIATEKKDILKLLDLAKLQAVANGGRPRAPTR